MSLGNWWAFPQKIEAHAFYREADGLCPPDVSCDEWAFSLLPLDVDLLSMELPEFFRDYFLVKAGALWSWYQ